MFVIETQKVEFLHSFYKEEIWEKSWVFEFPVFISELRTEDLKI